MPDIADPRTFQMTDDQMEACFQSALEIARDIFAPDVVIEFHHISIGAPEVYVVFAGWSKVAGRYGRIQVHEVGQVGGVDLQPGAWYADETTGEPDWNHVPLTPPWEIDKQWPRLLESIFYRVRPDWSDEPMTLELYGKPLPVEAAHNVSLGQTWSVWWACVVSGVDSSGARRCFGLKDGELEEFEVAVG